MAKKQITLTHESLTVTLGRNIGPHKFDIAVMDQATVDGIFEYGLRQVANDGGSSLREGESAEDGVRRRCAELQASEHSFGAGGGSRGNPTHKVAVEWLSVSLKRNKVAPTLTKAKEMIAESMESAFTAAHPKGNFEAFMADCTAEAKRRAESGWGG